MRPGGGANFGAEATPGGMVGRSPRYSESPLTSKRLEQQGRGGQNGSNPIGMIPQAPAHQFTSTKGGLRAEPRRADGSDSRHMMMDEPGQSSVFGSYPMPQWSGGPQPRMDEDLSGEAVFRREQRARFEAEGEEEDFITERNQTAVFPYIVLGLAVMMVGAIALSPNPFTYEPPKKESTRRRQKPDAEQQ